VAAQVVAPRAVLSSTELVSYVFMTSNTYLSVHVINYFFKVTEDATVSYFVYLHCIHRLF
jgi:hypothetical protein